jgi:cell division protein FtsB
MATTTRSTRPVRRRTALWPAAALGLGLAAVAWAGPVAAQQDTLQARIRESQERLDEIRAEREQLQAEMQSLQGQARNI